MTTGRSSGILLSNSDVNADHSVGYGGQAARRSTSSQHHAPTVRSLVRIGNDVSRACFDVI